MKKLSENFTVEELTHSDTAERLGIDNTPDLDSLENLQFLVDNVLQPLRDMYGRPIVVNSGYRSPKLNKAVGGSKTSQHMTGQAADITAGSKTENKELFNLVLDNDLIFDQLIDEKNYSWIHISYNQDRNRQQILHL